MDYTDLSRVKEALGTETPSDDAVLADLITAASRDLDRRVTGAPSGAGADYFALETIEGETGKGLVTARGNILYTARKSVVQSVEHFEYRASPLSSWVEASPDLITIDGNVVMVWTLAAHLRGESGLQVRLSYTGGIAEDSADLPADLVEAVTVLAVRMYREAQTGMADSVGVAELGSMSYTKAMPARVREVVRQYQRVAPW
jgi:hypothetical protein